MNQPSACVWLNIERVYEKKSVKDIKIILKVFDEVRKTLNWTVLLGVLILLYILFLLFFFFIFWSVFIWIFNFFFISFSFLFYSRQFTLSENTFPRMPNCKSISKHYFSFHSILKCHSSLIKTIYFLKVVTCSIYIYNSHIYNTKINNVEDVKERESFIKTIKMQCE